MFLQLRKSKKTYFDAVISLELWLLLLSSLGVDVVDPECYIFPKQTLLEEIVACKKHSPFGIIRYDTPPNDSSAVAPSLLHVNQRFDKKLFENDIKTGLHTNAMTKEQWESKELGNLGGHSFRKFDFFCEILTVRSLVRAQPRTTM